MLIAGSSQVMRALGKGGAGPLGGESDAAEQI